MKAKGIINAAVSEYEIAKAQEKINAVSDEAVRLLLEHYATVKAGTGLCIACDASGAAHKYTCRVFALLRRAGLEDAL